jgi:transposase
LLAHARRELFE